MPFQANMMQIYWYKNNISFKILLSTYLAHTQATVDYSI